VLHIALEVPLATLGFSGLLQRHHTRTAGVQVLHEALDGAALAGGVAALEQDHHALPGLLDPGLQLEQFDLQAVLLLLVAACATSGLTDIDDTLTRDGAIEPVALRALQALRAAGVPVLAITGRPHGWSVPFARAWPVAAIVAENGALALIDGADGVRTEFVQDEATRAHNARRLQQVAAQVLREVPGPRWPRTAQAA
jgi:phosphoserine phosphatase